MHWKLRDYFPQLKISFRAKLFLWRQHVCLFPENNIFTINKGGGSRLGKQKIVVEYEEEKKLRTHVPDNILLKVHRNWPIPLVVIEADSPKESTDAKHKTLFQAAASLAICNESAGVTVFQDRLEVFLLSRLTDSVMITNIRIPLLYWDHEKPVLNIQQGYLQLLSTIILSVKRSLNDFSCVDNRLMQITRNGKSNNLDFAKLWILQ